MIQAGDFIQIIGYLNKRTLNSRVLGWMEGEYIVVSFPAANEENEDVNFPKDAAVVCRGMIDGRMHGFKTRVLHSMSQPFDYGTAFEIALKIEETSYVLAEPYSSADFRHGPAAVVEHGFPVFAVAPAGKVQADVAEVIDWCTQRGASVAVVSDDPEVIAKGTVGLRLPPGVPEWLSPIVAVVAGQLFALESARSRGLDPDRPRSLSKITETR